MNNLIWLAGYRNPRSSGGGFRRLAELANFLESAGWAVDVWKIDIGEAGATEVEIRRKDWHRINVVQHPRPVLEEQLPQHPDYPCAVLAPYAAAGKLLEQTFDAHGRKAGWPAMVLVESTDGLPYFVFHRAWRDRQFLPGSAIGLLVREPRWGFADRRGEPRYMHGTYWAHRMEQFCARAADFWWTGQGAAAKSPAEIWQCDGPQVEEQARRDDCLPDSGELRDLIDRRDKTNRYPTAGNAFAGYPDAECGFSVVIPYYNMGAYVREAVESVLDSTCPPEEVIIVNDGSTEPESLEVLSVLKARHSCIRVLHQDNQGLGKSRIIGAKEARSDFLFFLDADDAVEPEFFRRALDILRRFNNVAMVTAWERYFGDVEKVWPKWDFDIPRQLCQNMTAPLCLVRKQAWLGNVRHLPDFDDNYEDYHAWLSIIEEGGTCVCLNEPLVRHRIRSGSRWDQRTRQQLIRLQERIVRCHPGLYERHGPELFCLQYANGTALGWDTPAAFHEGSPEAGETEKPERGPAMSRLARWLGRMAERTGKDSS
jgi:hypothetical protein